MKSGRSTVFSSSCFSAFYSIINRFRIFSAKFSLLTSVTKVGKISGIIATRIAKHWRFVYKHVKNQKLHAENVLKFSGQRGLKELKTHM